MNKKSKPSLRELQKNGEVLEEAKSFSVSFKVESKHITIKLPKKVLKYLKIDEDSNLNIIPVNNTLQITAGSVLTLIPAIDLRQLENQFVQQA